MIPHVTVRDVHEAVRFYEAAFGAEEISRVTDEDGSVLHAELLLGSGQLFLNEEFPEHGIVAGASGIMLHLPVDDVHSTVARALQHGAVLLLPICDQPWGQRYARVRDPMGYTWSLAQTLEDLSPEEVRRRVAATLSQIRRN